MRPFLIGPYIRGARPARLNGAYRRHVHATTFVALFSVVHPNMGAAPYLYEREGASVQGRQNGLALRLVEGGGQAGLESRGNDCCHPWIGGRARGGGRRVGGGGRRGRGLQDEARGGLVQLGKVAQRLRGGAQLACW